MTDGENNSKSVSPVGGTDVSPEVAAAFQRVEKAVLLAGTKDLRAAVEALEALIQGTCPPRAMKALAVLKIMGRVGDSDNAPKVLGALTDELRAASII